MRRVLLALPVLLVGACLGLSDVEDEKAEASTPDAAGVIDVYASDVGLVCEPGKKVCNDVCVPIDDPAHGCAAKGCAPCDLTGATAVCQNLTCKLLGCLPGQENCDGNAANGCEIDLTTDIANCGACGISCGSNNATASCVNGICGTECDPAYGNCNSQASDGCETKTDSVKNCGACGVSCITQFECVNEACRCTTSSDCTGGSFNQVTGVCTEAGLCDCENGFLCKPGKKCAAGGC
jgi:hypothetical protein